jgi:hypothetical protein
MERESQVNTELFDVQVADSENATGTQGQKDYDCDILPGTETNRSAKK